MNQETFRALDSFIIKKMAETRTPGLSIALIQNGEVIYAKGYGFRDVEATKPATPKTIYGIGSITKSFTALAILQLVNKGKISLDDPITNYVSVNVDHHGEKVTLHHLLTHSSGIPALGYAEALISGLLGSKREWLPIAKPEDIVPFMEGASDWAVAKPGSKFFYLNEGYVLLGKVIESVTGMPYREYIRENILKPLKMTRSYFSRERVASDPDVATPYIIMKDGELRPSRFPYGIEADGGLLSNVLDLANYIKMYLSGGVFEGKEIISKELLELMWKPHIKLNFEIFGGDAYGYGLMIHPNFPGGTLIGHGGSVLVYTAYIGFIPSKGLGVAVLSNASGYPPSKIGMYALMYVAGRDPRELTFIREDEMYSKLTGVYEAFKGTMRVKVFRLGNFLAVEEISEFEGVPSPLVPVKVSEDYAEFYTIGYYGSRVPVIFEVKDGRVELLYERYKFVKKEQEP